MSSSQQARNKDLALMLENARAVSKGLHAEIADLCAEIERPRKLCEDRPVYPPLSDKSDPYSAAFDAWLDLIDAAGRGEG